MFNINIRKAKNGMNLGIIFYDFIQDHDLSNKFQNYNLLFMNSTSDRHDPHDFEPMLWS